MVVLERYRQLDAGVKDVEGALNLFVSTLLGSNRSAPFFVDWRKARKNARANERALARLAKLSEAGDFDPALRKLLTESPETARVLPQLIAWRAEQWTVFEPGRGGEYRTSELDFSGSARLADSELEHLIVFCKEAGIVDLLKSSINFESYILGVEVGMDTNARKNRSGAFMERQVAGFLNAAVNALPRWKIIDHPSAKRLGQSGLEPPHGLKGRTFDYALVSDARRVAIETNFYDELGSKPQEIVDSYIHRAEILSASGWEFVWVTDGPAWKPKPTQLVKAFESLDTILNLELCRRGGLTHLLSG